MQRTSIFKGLIFSLFVVISANAQTQVAQPSAEHIAIGREVVETSGASKSFEQVIPGLTEQAKSIILSSNPDLSRDLNTIGEQIKPDFQKRVSELVNSIAIAYAKNFTIDELRKIRDFYASPEGKKMVATLPQVLEASYVQSQEWSQIMSRDILVRFRTEFAKKNIKI